MKGDDEASQRLVIEGTDKPDEISIFKEMVRFRTKLVQAVAIENINAVDDVLDNTPYFCQSPQVKKMLWDEFHDPVRKNERNAKFRR